MTLDLGQRNWDTHTSPHESPFGFLPLQAVGNGMMKYLVLFLLVSMERTHRLEEVDVNLNLTCLP